MMTIIIIERDKVGLDDKETYFLSFLLNFPQDFYLDRVDQPT